MVLQALSGKLQRLKPRSLSARNVLKLAGGTAGSQLITAVAAPILTRLYGPDSFGVLASFIALLALLNVLSSLRYELAIAVPNDDDDALALVVLCFVLVAISTAATALGVLLLGDQLVAWVNEPALKPLLWLLPVGVALCGVYQPLSYWAIRRRQFGLLATIRVRQSVLGVAINLLAFPLGASGLLLGQIVSQSGGSLAILRPLLDRLRQGPLLTPAALLQTMKRYSHFGLYSSPAGVLNIIGNQAPILLFASVFGASQLGQLALTQRLLLLPAALISNSVGQVFLQVASVTEPGLQLRALFWKWSVKLLGSSLVAITLLVVVLKVFGLRLFGGQWSELGTIALILAPSVVAKTVVSAVGPILSVVSRTKEQLLAQIVFCVMATVPLFAMTRLQPQHFGASMMVWSLSSSIAYGLFWLICLRSSHQHRLCS